MIRSLAIVLASNKILISRIELWCTVVVHLFISIITPVVSLVAPTENSVIFAQIRTN